MAQLVFVHGVANRGGVENDTALANRNTLFKTLLFPGIESHIYSPTWGYLIPEIHSGVFVTGKKKEALPLMSLAAKNRLIRNSSCLRDRTRKRYSIW